MIPTFPETTRLSWKDGLPFLLRCFSSLEAVWVSQLTPIDNKRDIDHEDPYRMKGFRVKRLLRKQGFKITAGALCLFGLNRFYRGSKSA